MSQGLAECLHAGRTWAGAARTHAKQDALHCHLCFTSLSSVLFLTLLRPPELPYPRFFPRLLFMAVVFKL